MSLIRIREAHVDRDESAILNLLERNLPEAATRGRYDWAYRDNPVGAAKVWLAETSSGMPIGTSAAFPREFDIDGQNVAGLVLSDFVVDPAYRSIGPALKLLRATLAAVDSGEFALAIDHPSETMRAIYGRIGGKELGSVARYVRPVDLAAIANAKWGRGVRTALVRCVGNPILRVRDLLLRWGAPPTDSGAAEFGPQHEIGSRLLGSRCRFFGRRNAEFLNWRYFSGIRFQYYLATVRGAGRVAAYAVAQVSGTHPMTIAEFVCPDDAPTERRLCAEIARLAHRLGQPTIQATCPASGALSDVLRRNGFHAREEASGPVLYIGSNLTNHDGIEEIGNWWITDGDRDG